MEDEYGFESCMRSVMFYIDELHADPVELLGKWTLRARQDAFFNKTMVSALNRLIDERNIRWDDGVLRFNKASSRGSEGG